MSEIKNSFLDLVGNTPLVRVNNLIKKDELKADVLAKLEYFNPAGSVKDRIAKEMILDALEKGLINENTTLIEPTSGNTGIGLSAVATALNLKIIFTMPETMSVDFWSCCLIVSCWICWIFKLSWNEAVFDL